MIRPVGGSIYLCANRGSSGGGGGGGGMGAPDLGVRDWLIMNLLGNNLVTLHGRFLRG